MLSILFMFMNNPVFFPFLDAAMLTVLVVLKSSPFLPLQQFFNAHLFPCAIPIYATGSHREQRGGGAAASGQGGPLLTGRGLAHPLQGQSDEEEGGSANCSVS